MRELLRSHEQDIVDPVILQLSAQNLPRHNVTQTVRETSGHSPPGTRPPALNPTLTRIAELERQLAQPREHSEQERMLIEPNPFSILNPTHIHIAQASESASGVIDSVETMFPGVERATLQQIIEN